MYDRKDIIGYCADVFKKNAETFGDLYPEAQSKGYVYQLEDNTQDWTTGFFTGILWICYELTGNVVYKKKAEKHTLDFRVRLDGRLGTDTHDLGFLYSLSAVADYKVTGNKEARKLGLEAADLLCERYKAKGGFIQAWGDLKDPTMHRLIIDCLLNIPLLFWAYEETGNPYYKAVASTHLYTTLNVIIREDGTTHHTFYFDPVTGAPLKGATHQGYSDTSCWARGQAWGICGTAFAYAYTKDEYLKEVFHRLVDYYVSKLPEDSVPYWDMIFTDGDEPRDSSAAAIAVCGMIYMKQHAGVDDYDEVIEKTMDSLCNNYLTRKLENSNGLLTEGMYGRTRGDNPECNIWGDYFFMEALIRLENKDWKGYF